MKEPLTAVFLFVVMLMSGLLVRPSIVLGDGPSDSFSAPVVIKAHKKAKKKHKKSKSAKLKVAKSSAGAQDEVSDQTEVSQQADNSGNKTQK